MVVEATDPGPVLTPSNNEDISLKKMLWQLGAFLLAFILLISIHLFFNYLIGNLAEKTNNERARLFIGEQIVQGIRHIKGDVYRMATTIGESGQRLIQKDIDGQIAELMTLLKVLEVGGRASQQLRLNLVENDRMIREVNYLPDRHREGSYILEIVDLSPKIDHIYQRIAQLADLLKQREIARKAKNKKTRMQLVDKIKYILKSFSPMFTRLEENANRLFFESYQRLDRLQAEISQQKRLYLSLEIGLVLLIFMAVMFFGYVSARRIDDTNRQLRYARDKMQRAKDEAEQASAAKTDFLSRMSHELRTPMNAILGFNQLIAYDKQVTNEQREYAGKIDQAGQHLLQLINEILDLSRIEHGKLQISSEKVSLKRIVEESFSLLNKLSEDKNIHMVHRLNPVRPLVKADYTRLKQVLINLLSNALKYNRDGGEVELFTEIHHEYLRVCIRDTGMGINPTRLPELFKPFNRLDADHSNIEGTGIGLALSKQLVERMGGGIGVESTPGVGSLFWFSLELLPTESGDETQPAQEVTQPILPLSEQTSIPGLQRSGGLILVAEDNLTNQVLIKEQLNFLGYHVDIVGNGQEALDRISSGDIELLLTDCNMPVMDGYQLTETLREKERIDGGHLPTIAITANALEDDAKRCYTVGMDDYVAKPVNLTELKQKLEQWIPHQAQTLTLSPETKPVVTGASDHEVFNSSVLEEIVGPNRSLQLRILKKFRETSPADMESLAHACGTGVLDEIAGFAHKIKSAAKTVGAINLGQLCEDLEVAAREDERKDIEDLSSKLSAQFQDADMAIARLIEDLEGSTRLHVARSNFD
ncbi:MAG: ATP-binding protein [Pseudomonadota bacterium]